MPTTLTSLSASVAAAVATVAPAAPTVYLVLEDEAKLLRDLRSLKGRDERTRKALKAQVFSAIKARLGVPSDTKVKVEVDDTTSDDYLVLKHADGRRFDAADDTPVRLWYALDGDTTLDDVIDTLADSHYLATDDYGSPVAATLAVPTDQRIAVVDGRVYVSLASDETDDFS